MAKSYPAIATYADHEVITPQNTLRKAVSRQPLLPDIDPIARAEEALSMLSREFGGWMDSECERLDRARRRVLASGFNRATKDALFHAAHDIKGEAATFGFPAVADAAGSLCRLLEYAPQPARIPMTLVDQHVDAVRAIIREYQRSDAVELANALTTKLREVTDGFLAHELRGSPITLQDIEAPPLTPSDAG